MENDLNRILRVRKTRERSIRTRIDALHHEIEVLRGTISALNGQRENLRTQWHDACALRGLVNYGQLQLHSERLSDLHARDAAIQVDLDERHRQLLGLEQDLDAAMAELRSNLAGQEKLASLVDSERARSPHGGGSS